MSLFQYLLCLQLEGMHRKESILCLLPSNDFLKWFIPLTSVCVSKLSWILRFILGWCQNFKIPCAYTFQDVECEPSSIREWLHLLSLWAPFFMSLFKCVSAGFFLSSLISTPVEILSIPLLCKTEDVQTCGGNKIKDSIYTKMCICMSYSQYRKKVKSLSRVWLCDPMDCSLPRSSVHGIFQAIVLGWGAISFSRGSSQARDRTWVSCIVGRCCTISA